MSNIALTCSDALNPWFGILDFTIAPPLLYYAYVPIAILALLFGVWVFIQDKHSMQSKLLLGISVSFVLYILNEIVLWTAVYANVVYFGWQMAMVLQMAVWIFSLYFIYHFITKKRANFTTVLTFSVLLAPLIILLPTNSNVAFFDATNCEAVNGPLWTYMYVIQMILLAFTEFSLYRAYRKTTDIISRQITLIEIIGASIFLGLYFATNIAGDLTFIYEINLIGPIGLICFIGILAFLIVRYKAFNIKLIGAQALVAGIAVLIGARLFYSTTTAGFILSAATLIAFLVSGVFLVRSVKKEVVQREEIQKLSDEKSEFISFASHQIRTPLTSMKGYAANILEGDYGQISPETKDAVQKILVRGNDVASLIAQYLDKSKLELGQIKYDATRFDLADLTKEVVKGFEPNVEQAKLTMKIGTDGSAAYPVNADKGKIKEVIGNLVDNSIKYTPNGSIDVHVSRKDDKALIKVSDTGVGMSEAIIADLFKKFGRAKDASKTNMLGSGLGLYLAKTFVEVHHGRVWAESEGDGKGSTFFVELPMVRADSSG